MQAQPKAVIFARVSSKVQEDEGYSLDSQLKLLRSYCKKKRLGIIKEFKIAETASKAQCRTVFRETMAYVIKNRIHHFVVEKTDRAARNIKDAAYLYDWIEGDEHRMLHCVKEGLELHKWSRSHVKFMWSVFIAFAKQYTDVLREETMKGWDEKLAQGWMPATPPPGYTTVTQYGKRIHAPDPLTFASVEPLFQFALLPDSTIRKATKEAANLGFTTSKGKPLTASAVHKMLTNPFYVGTIHFNGKEYPGAQEPLISKELFNAVQDKLHSRRHQKVRHHDPVFKGMITCIHCHAAVTWQLQKGRYYGACQRRTEACKYKKLPRQDRLEAKLVRMLEEIKDPKGKLLKKLQAKLLVGQPDAIVGRHREEVIKSLNKQLKQLDVMCESLYDEKLVGRITHRRYSEKYKMLQARITEVNARLARLHEIQGEQEKQAPEVQSKHPIVNLYLQSSPGQKRTIMSQLFKAIEADGDQIDLKEA
jgi:DNA invertase Pin-like site-specific DNA recombinase